MPAGLVIDATTGTISGTVAVTASRQSSVAVIVTATDDKGASTTESFSFAIANVPPVAVGSLPTAVLADGTSGVAITTASGFTNPLGLNRYAATGLPPGLSINAETGVISGTVDHDASILAPAHSGSGATLDGVYTIVVTASDGQGGSAMQTVVVHATNQAPAIVSATPDQQGYDGNMALVETGVAFTDANVGDSLTFTATGLPTGLTIDPSTGRIGGTIDKSASVNGPFHVTVTATDDKNAATSETFVWTIDDVAPTATPPLPDRAVIDGAAVSFGTAGGFVNPLGLPLTYSIANNGLPAGLVIDSATGLIHGTVDHAASAIGGGRYTVAVTADDGKGGQATNTFILTTFNQGPLVVAPTPAQSGFDGQTITPLDAGAAFSEANLGATLTYTAANLPKGLSIDPTTGVISGTIDAKASGAGPYTVHVTATDDQNASASERFVFTVLDNPPVATGTIATPTVADGMTGVSIATASGFSDPLGRSLTYSASGLPTGLNIDPTTGVISGTVDHAASNDAPSRTGSGATLVGAYTVVVTASDDQGGSVDQSFVLLAANTAPTLAATPTSDQANSVGDVLSLNVGSVFADPNLGDVLTFSASTLPVGLTLDAATGIISGTVDASAAATPNSTITVTATDEKGAAVSETFAWSIGTRQVNSTSLPDQAVANGRAITPIDTSAYFVGTPLSYAATGLPSGLTIDAGTGAITGTMDHDASASGPYTVSVTATLAGVPTIKTFTLTSFNQAPTVSARTPDQTGMNGTSVSVDTAAAFTDGNAGDVLHYTATGLPSGLSIDTNTGLVSGTLDPQASRAGPVTVTITATDDKGLAASETFTFTAINQAPTTSGTLAGQTYADGTTGILIATAGGFNDPLGLTLTYGATGLPAGLSIDPTTGVIAGTLAHDASASTGVPHSGSGATLDATYTVVVSASDGQGGVATQSFTIDATNQAPLVVAQTPDQVSANGNSAPVNAAAAFRDPNLGDGLSYSATDLPPGLTIDPTTGAITGTIDPSAVSPGHYTVVVTATDEKGAATSESFNWTTGTVVPVATPPLSSFGVRDGQALSVSTVGGFTNPLNLTYSYSATGLPAGLSIDAATGDISGVVDHDASGVAGGIYTVRVTADNGQGGTATNTFDLVATNQAPVASATPIAIDVVVGSPLSLPVHQAFSDPNVGDILTYTAGGLPSGLAIDPSTGVVSGTVAVTTPAGLYTVTVVATDEKGGATSKSIALTVQAAGTVLPPSAIAIPPITSGDGQSIAPIDVAGHFVDPNGLPLTFSVSGLPSGLSFDATTGTISGTLAHDASKIMPAGGYVVTMTADNGLGGTTSSSFTLSAQNDAPQIAATTPGRSGAVGTALTINASTAFADPNIGDVLTYSATGLPTGLAIDAATGIISGTIDRAAATGNYTVTIVGTDDKGAAASETTLIIVQPSPPVITTIAAVSAEDGQAIVPIDVGSHVSDPNGVPVSLSVTGLPAGLGFDPSTGVIAGTIDHDASKVMPPGGYTVMVTASDGQGGVATSSFTLTSHNSAPTILTQTRDRTVAAGSTVRINTARAFTDANVGDTLTFSAAGLLPGLAIDPATGLVTGVLDAGQTPRAYALTITATDDKGAAVSETISLTVTNPPPVVTTIPSISIADGVAITPIDVAGHFSDRNGLPLTFTVTGLPSGLVFDSATGRIVGTPDHTASSAMPVGGYIVVASASDGQGGSVATTFALVAVNGAPQVVAQTPDQSVIAGNPLAIDTSSAFRDPNVGDRLTFAATGLPRGLTIDAATGIVGGIVDPRLAPGAYRVVVTAMDDKGAGASEAFTVIVTPMPGLPQPPRTPVAPSAQPESGAVSAPSNQASSFAADGAVLDTVRALSGFDAPVAFGVDRVVVGAVNELASLGGLPTLTSGRVIHEVAASDGWPHPARFGAPAGLQAEEATRPVDFLGASLRSVETFQDVGPLGVQVDRIAVETLIRDNVILVAMTAPGSGTVRVVSYDMTRADGTPLPPWLEQSRRGLVFGKLPSDRQPIDLRITAVLSDGRRIIRSVVVDPTTGQIAPAPETRER